jgi:hypothetical protein
MKIAEISKSSNVNPALIKIINSGFASNLKLIASKKCSSITEIPSGIEEVWFEGEYLLLAIDGNDTYKVLNEIVEGLD